MQTVLDKLTGQSQVEGAGKLAVPDWMLDRVRLYYGFIRNNDSDVSSRPGTPPPPWDSSVLSVARMFLGLGRMHIVPIVFCRVSSLLALPAMRKS